MKKSEAELLEEIKKFIESGGSYDEAVAALKAVYGRKDEEGEAAYPPLPSKH